MLRAIIRKILSLEQTSGSCLCCYRYSCSFALRNPHTKSNRSNIHSCAGLAQSSPLSLKPRLTGLAANSYSWARRQDLDQNPRNRTFHPRAVCSIYAREMRSPKGVSGKCSDSTEGGSRCWIYASAPEWRAWIMCVDVFHSRKFADMAENR
jgi:hypothetical protein